jgi:C6 transcription factor Pro1
VRVLILDIQTLRGGHDWPKLFEDITPLCLNSSNSTNNTDQPIIQFVKENLAYAELLSCTVASAQPPVLAGTLAQSTTQDEMTKHSSTVIGIQWWLFSCITDIMSFRHWKEDQVKQSSLSIAELVKKATTIEQTLRDGKSLGKLQHRDKKSMTDTWILTDIFACGASLLLHATISDARPQVLEIKDGVSEFIAALQLIPYPEMLKRLSWPICM